MRSTNQATGVAALLLVLATASAAVASPSPECDGIVYQPWPHERLPGSSLPALEAAKQLDDLEVLLGMVDQDGLARILERFTLEAAAKGVSLAARRGNLEDVEEPSLALKEKLKANALSLAARFLSPNEAKEAVKRWLAIPLSGEERHARRIRSIDTIA